MPSRSPRPSNASLAWEDAENDDSETGRKRRKDRDGFHARRIARGAAMASRDALHDATPGMERGTYTARRREALKFVLFQTRMSHLKRTFLDVASDS
jgi:hypothetical protein